MTTIDLNLFGAKGALVEAAEGKWGMVIDQDLCTGCQATFGYVSYTSLANKT
jgi:hypothetical protein